MFSKNTAKKGLGPVVGTALLLVVAVVAVVSFQTWFQGYSSSLYTQGESQGRDLSTNVERVIDSTLYIKNNDDTLEVTKIEVNGEVCSENLELDSGVNSIDIYSCLSTTPKGSVASAVVYTNDKIYEHNFISTYTPLPSGFMTTWDTRIVDGDTSASNQIRLPLISSGTYNFNVSWGDGSNDTITSWNQGEVIHTYSEPGIYEVIIEGTIEGFDFNPEFSLYESINTSDAKKLVEIKQWGPLNLVDDSAYFFGAGNLEISARDPLNLTGVTNFSLMFANSDVLSSEAPENDFRVTGNINNWDTSNIVHMGLMFAGTSFNSPINTWNTSNVNNMAGMFVSTPFNQPLNKWDVSNVELMNIMFSSSPFNQDISNWDTSSVTQMFDMFSSSPFNQDISSWDVSNVEFMNSMFSSSSFNQNISSWNLSNVLFMDSMFSSSSFNEDITDWNTSNIVNMANMFAGTSFNQDISGWDVSSVQNMSRMFYNATNFNQNLSSWNVSSVFSCDEFNTSTPSWTLPKPALTVCGIGGGQGGFS